MEDLPLEGVCAEEKRRGERTVHSLPTSASRFGVMRAVDQQEAAQNFAEQE